MRCIKYAGVLGILLLFFKRWRKLEKEEIEEFSNWGALNFFFINWKSLFSFEKELLCSFPANLKRCDVKIAYTTTVPLSLSLSLCSKHLQTLCWKFILLSCTEETRTWKLVPVSMEANILTHFHLSEFKFSHLG